jgi:hypothetical protein
MTLALTRVFHHVWKINQRTSGNEIYYETVELYLNFLWLGFKTGMLVFLFGLW